MKTIFDYSMQGIEQLVVSLGQPRYRGRQLVQWLYRKGVSSFDDMVNLPGDLRRTLAESAPLIPPRIVDAQISRDGTRKFLLELSDGCKVETVAIPSRDRGGNGVPKRLTVCFSTQVGCPMACSFCATGQEGFTRNLVPGEMVWQILVCQREMDMRVSNIVAMGQGEPFLNYENVMAALRIMNSPDGLGVGARHISLSTCGITSGIHAFAHEPEQFTLAVSLHSTIQEIRDSLMPVCAGTSLETLHDELEYYQGRSGRRITLEYLMIDDITDTEESLVALQAFCRGLSTHVNLLKINHIEGSPYKPSTSATLKRFQHSLESGGIETTVRDSRGSDIDGACGQLKNSIPSSRSIHAIF